MGLKISQLAEAIEKNGGNITEAAKALGITRYGLQKRVAQSEQLKQILADSRESMVDLAEGAAKKQIREGNTAMIIFTLKTLGKDRGYVERSEITGKDGEALLINLDR